MARQKLNQYQVAQRARRERERRVDGIHRRADAVLVENRERVAGNIDALAEALVAAEKSGPEARAMYVRMFATLPMPETYLLCRLLLSIEREDAVKFVKSMGIVANVVTDQRSWR